MAVTIFRRLSAIALIGVLSTLTLKAQQNKQKPNPDEKPRNVKQELKTAYKKLDR